MASDHRLARRRGGEGGSVGASKAQAALARIIAVISTVPRPSSLELPSRLASSSLGGHDVDLNLRLGPETAADQIAGPVGGGHGDSDAVSDPPPPAAAADHISAAEEESSSQAESSTAAVGGDPAAAAESSANECEPEKMREEEERVAEKEISVITNVESCKRGEESSPSPSSSDEKKKKQQNGGGPAEGYLDLLLEAVKQELQPPEPEPHGKDGMMTAAVGDGRNKRRRSSTSAKRPCLTEEWRVALALCKDEYEEETAAPLVRSKRGRNQTLPSRYRDSSVLLEPWAKPPPVVRLANPTSARRGTTTRRR